MQQPSSAAFNGLCKTSFVRDSGRKVTVMSLSGRRALFISYNGMLEPLGQSQVIPYLTGLAARGVDITLLSFERASAFTEPGTTEAKTLKEQLAAAGVDWHWLRYHKRPSLAATIYDVLTGSRYAAKLIKQKRIELVHARSHIPATIALRLKKRFGLKMIFDVRGLLADEYVDAEHWRKGSIPYRLTKSVEHRALGVSEGIVTLTEAIWPILKSWESLRDRTNVIHEVIPCCANLELFKFSQGDRNRRRAELGLADRFVIVYSGSIDGWYLTEEMANFFAVAHKRRSNVHALWLTPGNQERIKNLMRERKVSAADYTVIAVRPKDMPSYLSASDAGLAFIKPCFSKLASSPTKYAEYLACGLPLVVNAGIGDVDSLVTAEKVGALVNECNSEQYEKAAGVIEEFVLNREDTRRRTRLVSERCFDVRTVGVERYSRLYERIFERSGGIRA
jgi:glycosyltransferase involved in cell wall biosynthesis